MVEIALVLTIVGLMLGGTLKAEELTIQAKIKRTVKDLNELAFAVHIYQDRYKHPPGDDPGHARWSINGVALTRATGQGDGIIDGGYASLEDEDETRKLWLDLRLAGYIEGDTSTIASGSAQPLDVAGGIIGMQTGGLGLVGLVICATRLPAKIAQAIDSQLDDGDATTGSIRALLETMPTMPVTATAPADSYRDSPGNSYVLCSRGGIG